MTTESATQGTADTDDGAPSNDRIISLSDGVFAFAMTLMVLTLDTPERGQVGPGELRHFILRQWPGLLAYALTFFVIANYWVVHHRTFQLLRSHDGGLIWLNIIFLFLISFLPFPTDVMGEYYDVPFAVTFYALSMTMVSGVSMLIWVYVIRRPRLCSEMVTPRLAHYNLLRGAGVSGVFLLSAAIAQVNVEVTRFFWLVLFPYHRILAHWFRDAAEVQRAPEPSSV